MLSYYNGSDPGQVPGLFGLHNYWWLAGAVWGSLIDYWNYTGDTQYVSLVQQALLFQVGPGNDYMVPNQTKIEVDPLSLPKKTAHESDHEGTYRETLIKQPGR